MKRDGFKAFDLKDWIVGAVLAAVAAIVNFASMANYAYPGKSAHLMVLWRGLDAAEVGPYPVFSFFAKAFGVGNVVAPVFGTLATVLLFFLVTFFLRVRTAELEVPRMKALSRIGGIVAALLFFVSPDVRAASSHLEPCIFALCWMEIALLSFIPWYGAYGAEGHICALALGLLWGVGFADSPLFLATLPLAALGIWVLRRDQHRRPYIDITLFLLSFAVAYIVVGSLAVGGIEENFKAVLDSFGHYRTREKWLFVFMFATVPFCITLLAVRKSFGDKPSWWTRYFHLSIAIMSILSVATGMAPAALMDRHGYLPVAATAFAAVVAGWLVVYWLSVARNGEHESRSAAAGRFMAYVVLGVLALVYAVTLVVDFTSFDSDRGAFADRFAAKVIDDLDGRQWVVSNGLVDDHLLLVAADRGVKLELVSLARETDKNYLAELAVRIRDHKLGGVNASRLSIYAKELGVLAFVQDWFKLEGGAYLKDAVLIGPADLLFGAGAKVVPEFTFYGTDPSRDADWSQWEEFDKVLAEKPGWGSYRDRHAENFRMNPVDLMRAALRTYMGSLANNRGIRMRDEKRDDDAFEMFDMVINRIDSDNFSALLNAYDLAIGGNARAKAHLGEFKQRINAIAKDEMRRYYCNALSFFYGYVYNPLVFARLGQYWAMSGSRGAAVNQMRRAIELAHSNNLDDLNTLASLYAGDNELAKSSETYEQVLAKEPENRSALVGMARVSLLNGDRAKARDYIVRAIDAAGDDPRALGDKVMLAMIDDDLETAKRLAKDLTDAFPESLPAWWQRASVLMAIFDKSTDSKVRAAVLKELNDYILPTMDKKSSDGRDYHLFHTRANVYLRMNNLVAARDAFVAASGTRADIVEDAEMAVRIDRRLNDVEAAERDAKTVLRRSRKSPIANYILGSISMSRGESDAAELYLRTAAETTDMNASGVEEAVAMSLNDLAELYRRQQRYTEALAIARRAVEKVPSFYIVHETLGSILMDSNGDLEEAERSIEKACELSRDKNGRGEDVRMLISLARCQVKRGDRSRGMGALRKLESRKGELEEYDRKEFEKILKEARSSR